MSQLTKEIKTNKSKARAYLYQQAVDSAVRRIRGVLTNAMPYAVCPACNGLGCVHCERNGFMNENVYKLYLEERN